MKQADIAIILGLGVAAFFFLNNSGNDTSTSLFDLSQLTNDPGDLARLQRLYAALQNQGLTDLQNQLLMAQMLAESGILTTVANYNNIDNLNNWAGITHNGAYAAYPDLQAFFNEYLQVLSKGSNPLGATSTTDFNNRLKANGYYTDNSSTYLHNLNTYFHQLFLAGQ